MQSFSRFRVATSIRLFGLAVFAACLTFAQSTGAIQGTVTDPSGAGIPNAAVTIHEKSTSQARSATTDSAGAYLIPSLPVGTYKIEVKAPGMAQTVADNLDVLVGSTARQDFALKVATASEVVEVQASAAMVETSTVSVGAVVNTRTVQEVPLNGRHFVDLAYLVPGTVTPPANGSLTAPLRGQGSFSFNSAGAREDSVNFQINGINLNDPIQNQVTFQPTINTVDEFRVENSTFSPEFGRNSGAIVNIATRSGVNVWHGEAYDYLRNNDLDARNFSNPTNIVVAGVLTPNPMSPFKRNQFGGDGGGAIVKNKTFVYLSYEALRQRQAVPISTTTLSAAQVAQANATSDASVKALVALIPLANSGTNQYVSSAIAPVNIDQGTANISQIFSDKNRLNLYYAIQKDQRNEPPSTDGNSFPGGGDQRAGQRQLLTLNETWVVTPTLVNEARIGANRIHIIFNPATILNPTAFGINSGTTANGLPQITISGAFTFGGLGGFPQGRGDNTIVLSDTVSWVHGNHTIKFGGDARRANADNFSATPGTFTFSSVANFLNDQASGFTANTSSRSNRTYVPSVAGFATDFWKLSSTFTAQIGLRYEWYGTPTEAENRFVVFDPSTVSLLHVGQAGGPAHAFQESAKNFQPRLGFAYDPFKNGKTVVRGAYAIMTDQPNMGLVTGLASNPPYAFPISFTPTTANPFVNLGNAFSLAGGIISPTSVAQGYKSAYFSEWNLNIQHQIGSGLKLMVGYFGSKGTDLNVARNYNQLLPSGLKPYPALSASSPISPGVALGNITVYESGGNSNYNGLWLTLNKRFSKGLQFDVSESYSKSIDDNSRNNQGVVIQDSNNIRGDRGLSDFDARSSLVIDGVYEIPYEGKFKSVLGGWQASLIEKVQTGNPLNFHTTNSTFTGSALLRPSVSGTVQTGFSPAPNGSASSITYIQNPTVFFDQGKAFGNLGRNVIEGPGFSNLDFTIVKNTRFRERYTVQFRVEMFDLLNQVNFFNPSTSVPVTAPAIASLGVITSGTRFPAGDSGSSRQIQLGLKFMF
jgi:hypothetical protein